jgi:hypothetical protein
MGKQKKKSSGIPGKFDSTWRIEENIVMLDKMVKREIDKFSLEKKGFQGDGSLVTGQDNNVFSDVQHRCDTSFYHDWRM